MGNFYAAGLLKKCIIMVIRIYQVFISPLSGRNCRFYPTCSNYFLQALERYGIIKGTWLFFKRIIKCHPFNSGGYDPLPEGIQK